jgi:hypothetical protein
VRPASSGRFALAQKLADAILYEGYVLYPYRASSAKNRVRFQFGVVAPRGYAEAGGTEPWEMRTECLVEPLAPGAATAVDLKVRCLQLQDRAVEEASGGAFRPVELLDVGGELQVSWDEGVERELEVSGIALSDLERDLERGLEPDGERVIPFELPGGREIEELRSPAGELRGRLVRTRWPISAAVRLSVERVGGGEGAPAPAPGLLRLKVRIENRTPWPPEPEGPEPLARPLDREAALRRSLVSAHTLLAIAAGGTGGAGGFVSLLDPPPAAAKAAAGCANLHTWPVLVGPEGSRDVVLSSPIILYDHPAIAPESPGDLCDATEIDEILTLRIMTLTDEEKRQARGTDPRARRIVERADSIPDEIMERLHGAVRSLRTIGAPEAASPEALPEDPAAWGGGAMARLTPLPQMPPEIAGWEEFLNPPGETPPEEAWLTLAGVRVGKGSPVRLRPSRRADSMDFFLAGREARVEGVFRDVEDATYVAVTLADDPNHDLQARTGRFFYFYPDEIEPLASADTSTAEETVEEWAEEP